MPQAQALGPLPTRRPPGRGAAAALPLPLRQHCGSVVAASTDRPSVAACSLASSSSGFDECRYCRYLPLGKVERRPIAMHIDAHMLGPSGCQPSRSSATTGSPGETGSYFASPIGPLRTYSQRSSALPRQRQQHQLLLVPFAEWNGASTARGPPALRAAPVESRRSERKPLKREAGMKGPHLRRDWARCCHICAGAARRDECSSARSYWRRLEGASEGLARCEKQTRACTSTHASTHARQALPGWTQRR